MIDLLKKKWQRFAELAFRVPVSWGQAVAVLMSAVLLVQPLMAQASDPPLVTASPVITVTGTINITLPQDVSFDNAPLVPPNYVPPFAAGPIIISGGDPNICPDLPSNRIIRNCNLGRSNFEKTIVNSWLAMRGLPESAAELIYQYGRSDLRDELRAYMKAYVTGAILKEPAQRTADETAVLNWLQEAVRQNEIAFYQAATDEYNRFNSNPCRFTLEPTVAQALDLKWDNIPYCFPSLGDLFASKPVPNANYFRQVALKKAYSDRITAFTDGGDRMIETLRRANIVMASLTTVLGAATVAALTAIAIGSLAVSVSAFIGFGYLGFVGISSFILGGIISVAGPFAIILVAVLAGVTAAISLASDVQNQKDIQALLAGRATAANPPNLAVMLNDSLGSQKIDQTLTLATLPEVASTTPLPAADGGTPFFVSQLSGPSGPAASFNYRAYDKAGNFNLQVQSFQRNWFLQTGTDTKGNPVARFSRTLEFFQPTVDSDSTKDVQFTAYLVAGGRFVVSRETKSDDISCPADPVTGLSPTPIDPKCGSYVTNTVRMRQGTNNVVQLRLPQPPVFVGVNTALFTVGGNRTFFPQLDSTSAGLPCSLSSAGSLPAGVTFSSNGFRGTATATGVFPVVVTANCGGTTSTRNYTIRAEEGFRFVWPTATTTINLVRGRESQFTIRSNAAQADMQDYFQTGTPFPLGMSAQGFNPDGSVTVKGKPTGLPATIGKFTMFYTPISGGPTSIIDLTPRYNLAPPTLPTVAATTTVDWPAGVASSYTFDGSAANVQVRWSPVSGLPPWATFTDLGNNTARITGTPPPVSSMQEFPVVYKYEADGDDQPLLRQFTLRIRVQPNSPALSTTPPLYFRSGSFGSGVVNSVTLGGAEGLSGTWTVLKDLPPGLTATPSPDGKKLTIAGTPTGAGGLFQVPVRLVTGGGSTQRDVQLIVTEPAALNGIADRLIIYTGSPIDISLSATRGFPRLAMAASPGDGIRASAGTVVSLSDSEAAALASNGINWDRSATGRLRLTGTPVAPATYFVNLSGQTIYGLSSETDKVLVGGTATRALTIVVIRPADLDGDGSVSCKDVGIVKAAFGKVRGQAGFSDVADTNRDGQINILDLSYVQSRLPRGTVCP